MISFLHKHKVNNRGRQKSVRSVVPIVPEFFILLKVIIHFLLANLKKFLTLEIFYCK